MVGDGKYCVSCRINRCACDQSIFVILSLTVVHDDISKNFLMKSANILFIVLCLALSNCSKKDQPSSVHDTNILTYSIQNTAAQVEIQPSQHAINIRFPDSLMNADDLVADFTLSPGC